MISVPLLMVVLICMQQSITQVHCECPVGTLVIPSSPTSIGADAYKDCTAITAVTIPAAVTAIDATAFTGCTAIASLTLDTPLLGTTADFVATYFADSKGSLTELTKGTR